MVLYYQGLVFGVMLLGVESLLAASLVADQEQFDCLIEPHMVVNVSSAVEGVVESINVEKSDQVDKGAILARLESKVEEAAVAQARARARMEGEILAKRTSHEFAERKLQRIEELFANKAVSSFERDEATTDLMLAKMELRQASDNKKLAQLDLNRAQQTLNRRTVRSPISGIVVERFVAAGEFVEEQPLLKLAVMDPLKVEVIVPAALFGRIENGMHAKIQPEYPPGAHYFASVSIVDRIIDAASGTFGVRLELPNPGNKIPGGLDCRVQFLADEEVTRDTVPSSEPVAASAPASETYTDADSQDHPVRKVETPNFASAAEPDIPPDLTELARSAAGISKDPESGDAGATYKLTNTDALRLRSQPDSSAKVRLLLPKGTILKVLDSREGWAQVLTDSKIRGWVATRFLDDVSSASLPPS